MSGIMGHVVRRSLDAANSLRQAEDNIINHQMSKQAIAALALTFFSMLFILFSIRYTYGEVVATIATVESPSATVVAEIKSSDEPDAPLLSGDDKSAMRDAEAAELIVVKNKPITSKLYTTIRHLRARGGILSRFRGLSAWIFYHGAAFHLSKSIAWITRRSYLPIVQGTSAILAAVLLGSVGMAWTHIVISDPSPKMWFRRIPSKKAWLKVAPATALFAVAEQLTVFIPVVAFFFTDLPKIAQHGDEYLRKLTCAEQQKLIIQALLVLASGFFTALLVLIPASVTLTRVQASMLPETDESIVPFDRSFGGKVVPEIVGGSGKIGLFDAWKTFGWASRFRLLRVYVKVAVMQLAIIIGFLGIFAAELRYIEGERFGDYIIVAKARMNGF